MIDYEKLGVFYLGRRHDPAEVLGKTSRGGRNLDGECVPIEEVAHVGDVGFAHFPLAESPRDQRRRQSYSMNHRVREIHGASVASHEHSGASLHHLYL